MDLDRGPRHETTCLVDKDFLKVRCNRKNKPILVKGVDFEREFESILSAVNYFETALNIKLDRKTLNLRLKDGGIYKGYSFSSPPATPHHRTNVMVRGYK